MRKVLSFFLVYIFLFSSISSLAEPSTGIVFIDTMPEKLAQFNLAENDYAASVSVNGVPFQATLRQNQDITEINLSELVKLQLNGNNLILLIPGQKYAIDLQALIQEFQTGRFGSAALAEDGASLQAILQRFLVEVLMPFMEIHALPDGFSIYLKADIEPLLDRVSRFIDSEMKADSLSRLFDRYRDILTVFFPEMPSSFDALQSLWNNAKESWAVLRSRVASSFSIFLNLDIKMSKGGITQCICYGSLKLNQSRYDLNFEYQDAANAKYTRISITEDNSLPRKFLSLEIQNNSLFMELYPTRYEAYLISLSASDSTIAGNVSYAVRRREWLEYVDQWKYLITGSMNGKNDIQFNIDPAYGEPFSMKGHITSNAITSQIQYYNDQINISLSHGSDYLHMYLLSDSPQAPGYLINFWINRQAQGMYSFEMNYNRSRRGDLFSQNFNLSGLFGANYFHLEYDGMILARTCNLRRFVIDLDFREPYFKTFLLYKPWRDIPQASAYQLRIQKEENGIDVEFAYPYVYWSIQGSGKIAINPYGQISGITGEARVSYKVDPAKSETQRLFYYPGNLTLIHTEGLYALSRIQDSANQLTYILSRNGKKAAELTSTWKQSEDGHSFDITVSDETRPVFNIEIHSMKKTAIEPVSMENATEITIDYLLRELQRVIHNR